MAILISENKNRHQRNRKQKTIKNINLAKIWFIKGLRKLINRLPDLFKKKYKY